MTAVEYLKSIGMTDDEIKKAQEAGVIGNAKFEAGITGILKAKTDAETLAAKATKDKEDFEGWYNGTALPEISTAMQDAIKARSRVAELEARLAAAKDYGFLSDDIGAGSGAGAGAGSGSGSGAGTGAGAGAGTGTATATNDKYVADLVASVPGMIAKVADISNEHFRLFGTPLESVYDLIEEARQIPGGKGNVVKLWEKKYNVEAKRAEIKAAAQKKHDDDVAARAVEAYKSTQSNPETRSGVISISSHFNHTGKEDARKPWINAGERKAERRAFAMKAFQAAGVA